MSFDLGVATMEKSVKEPGAGAGDITSANNGNGAPKKTIAVVTIENHTPYHSHTSF